MQFRQLLVFSLMFYSCFAINLSDFVPNFLQPTKNTASAVASEDTVVKPIYTTKRNSSNGKSWYCNKIDGSVSNVFCSKENKAESIIVYHNAPGDQNAMVDNSVNSSNSINQDMAARNNSLQDQKVASFLYKQSQQVQDTASVPIQAGKNVKVNVNAEQVQFNIQY